MGIKQDRQQDDIPMGGDRAAMTNLAGKIDRSVSFFGQNMTFVMGFGAFGVMTWCDFCDYDRVNTNHAGVSMKLIERWVESIPMRMEFPIVMLWAFGYSFGSVLYTLLSLADTFIFISATAIAILVAESSILLTLGWFLRQRGWTLARLGLVPSWRSTLMGIVLMPIAYIVYALIFVMLPLVVPAVQTLSPMKSISISGVELWQVILIALLNPIFEEVFVCGYAIQWLKKYNHIVIAVMISASIRAAYHLYQPIPSAIGIWGIGLVFGSFYARTNCLWAVVVAHVIFDLWGLLGLPQQ